MNYKINVTVLDDGGYYVFQVPDKIKNPQAFTLYEDDITSLDKYCAMMRELSWSFDGSEWNQWQPLTAQLFNSPDLLCHGDVYLRFRFTRKSGTAPMEVVSVSLEYDSADPVRQVTVISEYMGLEFCADPEFNPYKVSEAGAQLESALNTHINQAFGMPDVQWFHVEPDMGNADSILNEYSTWKESGNGGHCLKIMVPENALPDPSLLHTEWGVDFEKFECHVQIEVFKLAFGVDAEVRQEDFVYFLKFNKLFYVSSVGVYRGTDGIGQYYKFQLKKYDENLAVKKSDQTRELLDALAQGHDKNVSKQNQEEGVDVTNELQNEVKTVQLDNLRSYIDPAVIINDEQLFNNGTVVSNHNYDLTKGMPGTLAVVYKPKVKLCEDTAITFWLNRADPTQPDADLTLQYYRLLGEYLPFSIITAKRLDRQRVQVMVDKAPKVTGIYPNCFIQQGSTVFLIEQMIDDYNYIINTPNIVQEGIYRIATCEMLPSTYANMTGISANFVAGRFIYLIVGNMHFMFDTGLANIVTTWMAFVINISNSFSFIQTYVYEIEERFPQYPGKYSTVLKLLSKQSQPISAAISGYIGDENPLYLNYGNTKITNIRLWRETIEEELHSLILNQAQVQAASKTFVIDNADPVYNLDKLGRGVGRWRDSTPMNPAEGGTVTGTPR